MTALHDRVTDLGLTGRSFLTIHDFAPAEIAAPARPRRRAQGGAEARPSRTRCSPAAPSP